MAETIMHLRTTPLPANWRGTPQQFFDAIAERLEVYTDLVSVFTGTSAPTEDKGPWLKDGTKWYVWDSTQTKYVPADITDSLPNEVHVGEAEPSSDPLVPLEEAGIDPEAGGPRVWFRTVGSTIADFRVWLGTTAGWVAMPKELVANAITGLMIARDSISRDHIRNGEVTSEKLAGSISYAKLSPGGAGQVIRTNANSGAVEWGDLSTVTADREFDIATTGKIKVVSDIWFSHGLPSTPRYVRAVIKCKSEELGYTVGDEVDIASLSNNSGHAVAAVYANASKVGTVIFRPDIFLPSRASGGSWTEITATKWLLKMYFH